MNYFSIKFYIIFIFQTKNYTTMNSSEDIKLIPTKIILQRWHMWFGNAYRPIVKESRLNDALYHFIKVNMTTCHAPKCSGVPCLDE